VEVKINVISFLCILVGSSTVVLQDSLRSRQRMRMFRGWFLLDKMATVRKECNAEEQRSVVLLSFLGKRTQCKGYS
jgi:hypothetical protein